MSGEVTAPCQHEWLPETRYRDRRCAHCGAHPFEDALRRFRRRAHVHVGTADGEPQPPGSCYGPYETCGEHHLHSTTCGGRELVCGRPEDRDAVALVEWFDAVLDEVATTGASGRPTTEIHPPNTALGRRVGIETRSRR